MNATHSDEAFARAIERKVAAAQRIKAEVDALMEGRRATYTSDQAIAAAVLDAVSQATGVTVAGLLSVARTNKIARPRQLAYWLLRQKGWSLPKIAHAIGGRDHTSVLSGLRKVRLRPDRFADWLDHPAVKAVQS